MFVSILIFESCIKSSFKILELGHFQSCLHKSLVPLVTILAFIILKVICFREQRVMMWSAFVVCLSGQVWILKNVIGSFKHKFSDYEE